MIKKLKRKFVIVATVSMIALMTVLIFVMNLVNYSSVVSESDEVLDVISRPDAPFFSENVQEVSGPVEDTAAGNTTESDGAQSSTLKDATQSSTVQDVARDSTVQDVAKNRPAPGFSQGRDFPRDGKTRADSSRRPGDRGFTDGRQPGGSDESGNAKGEKGSVDEDNKGNGRISGSDKNSRNPGNEERPWNGGGDQSRPGESGDGGGDQSQPGENRDGGRMHPGEMGDKPMPHKWDGADFLPRGMSMEVPYESRFFSATLSADGEVINSDLTRIVTVDEDKAEEYIKRVTDSRDSRGFVDNFRYIKQVDEEGTKIVFLDCGRKLASFRRFLIISIITGLVGCLVVFAAFMLAAGRIVAPIAESYEKQKRFISDAGHEIKTPLTIINANVDLLESEGEKEELTDIRKQTVRLTELTNNLIMLSKMEEAGNAPGKIEFPLSDLVSETVNTFRAPAMSGSLELKADIKPGITLNGAQDSIRCLMSVLLENAIKYSAPGSKVEIGVDEHKKNVSISVVNATKDAVKEEDLAHVFDRFFRTDMSRNSETGGHGIGLSIAKAIVTSHGGTITATTKTGHDFCVNVVLPK